MKLRYHNDVNVDLLNFMVMMFEHTRSRYNLDILHNSFKKYHRCDISKETLMNDLHTIINHYINIGSNDVFFDAASDNILVVQSIIDVKTLLERVIMKHRNPTTETSTVINDDNNHSDINKDRLKFFQILDGNKGNKSHTLKSCYSTVNHILSEKTAFYRLHRERLKETTPSHNFVNTCTNDDNFRHSMKILKYFNMKTKDKVKWNKHKNHLSKEEFECFSTNKHFLPILIKNVTDMSLGDCSYLDTCHKFQQNPNSCKYVHYFEYNPLDSAQPNLKNAKYIELESEEDPTDPLFTFNMSNYKRSKQSPLGIQCDIRQCDFDIIEKNSFNAVIADPPWNIHTNAAHGGCNDEELFELPLNKIHKPVINYTFADYTERRKIYKDGGIMALWVTVRSINLGKRLLLENGYKIANELSWIKINQLCRTIVTGRTGHWLNHSKEHLLIGYKGGIDNWLLLRQQDLDLIVSQTRETNRKPDELYEILERLCGEHSLNLELFGRRNNLREGWVTLGNEL